MIRYARYAYDINIAHDRTNSLRRQDLGVTQTGPLWLADPPARVVGDFPSRCPRMTMVDRLKTALADGCRIERKSARGGMLTAHLAGDRKHTGWGRSR